MVSFYGDYNLTETVNIPFNTFTSDDPSASCTVTDLVAGDIYVHKDGVEGTPGGITVSLNVGTVNGNHLAILDLSNTDDEDFYAVGGRYQVRMEGVTIDGATINAWIGAFSIGCTLRPTTVGRTVDVESTGEVGLDFNNIKDATGAHTLTNITVPVATAVTDRVTADITYIHGTALTETDGQLAARFVNFFDQASAGFNIATALSSFKATGFAVASDVTTAHSTTDGKIDGLNNFDGTGATLHSDYNAAKTAAQASVLGAMDDVAAFGDPTENDTMMQYVKQIVDSLVGSTGVAAFPTEAAPANNVSLAEVIRAIHADVTGLNGSAMRGTDNAALAATALSTAVWTAPRAGALTDLIDGGRLDLLIDAIKTAAERLTAARAAVLTDWINDGRLDVILDAILANTGTDGVVVASETQQAIADEVLKRAVTKVEDAADKHSLGGLVMFVTNFSISGDTLTAKKPSNDSPFQTYTLTSDEDANPVTGVS